VEPAVRIDRGSKHGLAFKNEMQEARLQSGHDLTEVVSRIDIVDAVFSLQLHMRSLATT
jgi:biotin carboxylase